MSGKGLLLIDADDGRRQQLKGLLESLNCGPVMLCSPHEWRYRIENSEHVYAVLLGPCPGPAEQLGLYDALREWRPQLPVLLYHGRDRSVPLMPEQGVGFFVRVFEWPVAGIPLQRLVEQAVEYALEQRVASGRSPELFRALVGKSEGVRHVRELIDRVSTTDATVLILGESGTGKEVVARNLHYHSPRRGKSFLAVNCGAIPSELLESELMGHEKGAFTGAISTRQGRFELAEGGTLFLDEIGDMSLAMQVKLLRVIEERTFERVGGNRSIRADVRLIAATHRNLERSIQEGRFREDLFYRLNVFPINMPPLRQRTEDLPLLVAELNARLMRERHTCVRFSAAAMNAMQQYRWPGNVRELANLVERLAILFPNGMVELADLPARYREPEPATPELSIDDNQRAVATTVKLPPGGLDLKEHLNNIEYSLIMQALSEAGGVVAHAASLLKLPRTTLIEKLRKYGVRGEGSRDREVTPPSATLN
ncbi:MAG: sigma-54-dependent Fis family transcriptional regulator [Gammaproteobacteria bacterium]|nr:sigma-54-dependent Fis family transcriptional regulator [Gammaproteobacteria bacterium]